MHQMVVEEPTSSTWKGVFLGGGGSLVRGGSGNLAWGRRGISLQVERVCGRGLDRELEEFGIEAGKGVQLVVEDGVDIWLVVDRVGIWLEVKHEVSIDDITHKRPRPVSARAHRFQLHVQEFVAIQSRR